MQSFERDVATPSLEVVRTIAEHDDVHPLDLDKPLNDAIDPDALDALIGHPDGNGDSSKVAVEFSYDGYRIRVDHDGSVSVIDTT